MAIEYFTDEKFIIPCHQTYFYDFDFMSLHTQRKAGPDAEVVTFVIPVFQFAIFRFNNRFLEMPGVIPLPQLKPYNNLAQIERPVNSGMILSHIDCIASPSDPL